MGFEANTDIWVSQQLEMKQHTTIIFKNIKALILAKKKKKNIKALKEQERL